MQILWDLVSVGVGNTHQNPPSNVQVSNFSWRVLAKKSFMCVHTELQYTQSIICKLN